LAEKNLTFEQDPLWYKDAIIYQVHLKSFYDSNDDGIGDFRGLLQKLDYLESLGVTAIWVLPFFPSPLRDDGYDIADYYNINPDYGTLSDFRKFLREAHSRGIRVIIELVVNHTSDQHPWFQRARRAKPNSAYRNYYVWSDTPEKYSETRIIFKDFEGSNWTWDPVAKAYFWHRFYSHQPDLNYDNPRVQKEIIRVMDFWFDMGVDGMRLDAVPYLFEREGTNCENLPETHQFLKKLRKHVDREFKDKMILAEANQWPEDASKYFGEGDECHMAFHFPVMPRIFMGSRMEDRFPIIDILEQTPALPEGCQWAMFLRNHDELTLEMVTDEERDYMYRVYAKDPRARINLGIRRRLAPLLENNRRKIELMNIILFSLPGTPIIYYGDEIGMGDNYYLGDRDGVRTPMQWSSDRNAGFSRTNPQKLYLPVIIDPEYNYEAINVETQERNLSSLLWWMKRVIAMRKNFRAFSRGTLEFLFPDNPKVLTFVRQYEEETILVVINLSRFTQYIDLDLSKFSGYTPEEVFSQNKFPIIREAPYFLSLGPYDHYWFSLEPKEEFIQIIEQDGVPALEVEERWDSILENKSKIKFEKEILPVYLKKCRWFGGKAQTIRKVIILEKIAIPSEENKFYLLFLQVQYATGPSDQYLLPISFAREGQKLKEEFPQSIIAEIHFNNHKGFLFDGIYDEALRQKILQLISKRKKIKGVSGELVALRGKKFRTLLPGKDSFPNSRILKAEQSNTSAIYGDHFFLKLYRRVEGGINPDAETVGFLTEIKNFEYVPPFAGSLEYHKKGEEPQVLGLLQGLVPNEGDAWTYTLNEIGNYFERVLALEEKPQLDLKSSSLFDIEFAAIPNLFRELIGAVYLEKANLLGKRTAEMHLALSSSDDPAFSPEPFSTLYQRSLYQSLRSNIRRGLSFLSKQKKNLSEEMLQQANAILESEKDILNFLKRIMENKISGLKIRIHGDYHLGQVLNTGKDFVIIDFEGEPAKPPSERRLKYSALRDVAGMIRSFHYAVYSAFFKQASLRPENITQLEPWVEPWYHYVSGIFLNAYMKKAEGSPIVPKTIDQFEILLQLFLLNKAVYELNYEMNNRPDWVIIPIKGLKPILGKEF